jgi:hypothetical protein
MSRSEVEAILEPEGAYRTVPTEVAYHASWWPNGRLVLEDDDLIWGTPDGLWEGDAGNILVIYRQERVTNVAFVRTRKLDESYLRNLRWRAERLWRRICPSD